MKQTISMIGFITIILSIMLFSLDNNLFSNEELKLLQIEQKKIEIFIFSRSFMLANPHYEPVNATATVGTLVEWVNGDVVQHTATSDRGIQGKLEGQIFDSGPILPKSIFQLDTSRMLDDAYSYHCTLHPWTKGVLTLVTEPINITTDKKLYFVGEKVTVSGTANIPTLSSDASNTLPENFVNITTVMPIFVKVFTAENELYLSTEIITLSGGTFSYTFIVKDPGMYTATATINGFSASKVFEIRQPSVEKVSVLEIEFTDVTSNSLNFAKVGQKVFIRSQIKNMQEINQDYTYAVQIKNSDQETVLLIWKNASIKPLTLSTPAITWIPKNVDTYSVEIFIWNNMILPEPLSKHMGKINLLVQK